MFTRQQFRFCSITAMWHSASYLSSVCWFLRLHLLNSIQRSRHMTHHFFREDFPITSAENELVFFFSSPESHMPVVCHCTSDDGRVVGVAAAAYTHCAAGSVLPLHLLWLHWLRPPGLHDVWVLRGWVPALLYVTIMMQKALMGFVTGVYIDYVFSTWLLNCFFLPNILHHFTCSAIITLI